MAYSTVFKRYELKYLLSCEQLERIKEAIAPFVQIDKYGKSNIRNIYLDTENYRLIRRSIEKPLYKEKLRIRSYGATTYESTVFVELKKKHDSIVYKRRLPLCERDALAWISGEAPCPVDTQISREIDYFLGFYGGLRPSMLLSYDREAYYEPGGGDFRITFDDNILAREDDLRLSSRLYGHRILPEGRVLMELKCSGGIPLWMTEILSREKIYKTSFSKYGTAYTELVFPRIYSITTDTHKETVTHGSYI